MPEQIALGFSGCIDYEIVWDSNVIEALIHQHAIRVEELNLQQTIHSERDLVVSILSFLHTWPTHSKAASPWPRLASAMAMTLH